MNVLKVIKATKLLDEEINKASNKLGKYSEVKDESRDKEHIVILKNVNDINSLINHQEEPDVKRISVLKYIQVTLANLLITMELSNAYLKKKIKVFNSLQDG